MERKGFPLHIIKTVKGLYNTEICIAAGNTSEYSFFLFLFNFFFFPTVLQPMQCRGGYKYTYRQTLDRHTVRASMGVWSARRKATAETTQDKRPVPCTEDKSFPMPTPRTEPQTTWLGSKHAIHIATTTDILQNVES